MNNASRYILIAFIVIVLTGAGVGMWLYISKSPVGEVQNPQQNPNTIPTGSYTQTVTIPAAQQGVVLDPDKLHSDLFNTLSATKVKFSPITAASAGEAGEVYRLYAGSIATNTPLQAAVFDLNDDTLPEVLVYQNTSTACGAGGCEFDAYVKVNGTWQLVFTTLAYEWVGLLNTRTNGYADLLISVKGDPGYMTRIAKLVWNGSAYELKTFVAVWNGEAFDLLR